MNLQIINGCVRSDPGLPTEGTDPGRRYLQSKILKEIGNKKSVFARIVAEYFEITENLI